MDDLWVALRGVTQLLVQLQLPYAVMGGIAVRVYGIPRPTYDVDFTVAIARDDLPVLYRSLEGHGFSIPEPFASGWVDQISGLPLVKIKLYIRGQAIDIDVFLAETDFQKSVISRTQAQVVQGIACRMVTAEDLILLKLIANRTRDMADIGDVLFMQGQLDVAYMRKWASQLNISSGLEAVLADHESR